MRRRPTYLRVVATTACPLSCSYCHAEGDWQDDGARGLAREALDACLAVAVAAAVHKIKFLGGEPMARRDLPHIVDRLRERAPAADLSVITSGVLGVERARALFAAGLDRMNVSIHGWHPRALARRGGGARAHAHRQQLLDWLVDHGYPLKLNYVLAHGTDLDDVEALLAWAAGRPVVVNLLDDLRDPRSSPAFLMDVVRRLRGGWDDERIDDDPDSLPTTRLSWADGLEVEVKTSQLGRVAPWTACESCPARTRCREGIFALRLTHDGRLQTCMDRADLSLPLVQLVAGGGDLAPAIAAWNSFVSDPLAGASIPARHRLPVLQEMHS